MSSKKKKRREEFLKREEKRKNTKVGIVLDGDTPLFIHELAEKLGIKI